jgi:hypothetical protein
MIPTYNDCANLRLGPSAVWSSICSTPTETTEHKFPDYNLLLPHARFARVFRVQYRQWRVFLGIKPHSKPYSYHASHILAKPVCLT